MPFCPKCGVEIDYNINNCPLCTFKMPAIEQTEKRHPVSEKARHTEELEEHCCSKDCSYATKCRCCTANYCWITNCFRSTLSQSSSTGACLPSSSRTNPGLSRSRENHSETSSARTVGAKGRNSSLYLIFRFITDCIRGSRSA